MFGIHKFVSTVLRNRVILEVLIYMLLRHTCKNESTTQHEQNGKPSPLENRTPLRAFGKLIIFNKEDEGVVVLEEISLKVRLDSPRALPYVISSRDLVLGQIGQS